MIVSWGSSFRRVRAALDPERLLVFLLGLRSHGGQEHGLILVGLPGLSHGALQQAIKSGSLPFFTRLRELERYRLHPMYSGLPSTRPAVEAAVLFNQSSPASAASLNPWPEGVFLGGTVAGSSGDFYPGWREWFLAGRHPWAPLAALIGLPPVLLRSARALIRSAVRSGRPDLTAIGPHLERELTLLCCRAELSRGVRFLHLVLPEVLDAGPKFLPWLDDALCDLWHLARRLVRRDYELWVYSGHGLEQPLEPIRPSSPAGVTAASGTIGHFYLSGGSLEQERDRFLGQGVPLVAYREADRLRLFTRSREYGPDELFEGHPYRDRVTGDLKDLCSDPRSGDLVLLGWSPSRTVTFGDPACGGPGPAETDGFVFLPATVRLPGTRPLDGRALHQAARGSLADQPLARKLEAVPRTSSVVGQDIFRIMTYNVHACRGGDGRVSPARIARVIGEFFPDVVALQELDVGRRRSAFSHQAREIAAELQYAFYFYPAIEGREGHFGNAILSRLPLRLVKAGLLPRGLSAVPTEPRALLWVAVELPTHEVQVLNTHLSLLRQERLKQVEALLGPEWLGDPRCQESAVLCGDFNAGPGSPELGALAGRLQDVQDRLPEPARNTWFSSKPVRRLDYILVSSHFGVEAVHVPRTALVQDASDHLPLVSDLTLL